MSAWTQAADENAGNVQLDDSPRRAFWIGGGIAFLFFVVLLGWASIARLDAAAYGQGQVVVAGNRQVVQHRYGGDIAEILVRDGQQVRQGQVLIRLAGSDVAATERALAGTVIDLMAQRARLSAEVTGQPIRWPAQFATMPAEDQDLIAEAKRLQLAQHSAQQNLLASSRSVLGEQRDQITQQIRGYNAQEDATAAQRASLEAQLQATRRLAANGDVSRNTVRSLERSLAELNGNQADYSARAAASREQIAATRQQAVQLQRETVQQSAGLLRDTQFQLNDALPKWIAAKDQLERTIIRAPVSGRIVDMKVFSEGGVLNPGQPILDIVPDEAPLEIRAQFAPDDIDGVYRGRQAEVKFLSLHDRDLPIVLGRVADVSADSIEDERTGARYFLARVVVPDDQVELLRRARGGDPGIHPGVPVQTTVKLRPRTALQYLLDPLTDNFSRSFGER